MEIVSWSLLLQLATQIVLYNFCGSCSLSSDHVLHSFTTITSRETILGRMRKQATLRISDTLCLYKNETAVRCPAAGGTLQQTDN